MHRTEKKTQLIIDIYMPRHKVEYILLSQHHMEKMSIFLIIDMELRISWEPWCLLG